LVHTGHSSSSCTLLVCAAAADVFRPNVRSGFFDSTSDSSVLDGVSPSSLRGDSGMPIFKFPGAIQLSSTTITTTLSTTPVSSPTLPTFFPDSHLPPAPIAPTDFSSPLSSSSSSQSLTQLSPKNSHPSPDSFPPTGSRTLECQHSRRWGSSHHEKELGSGGRAAHVQKLLCNNNKPVLHNNIMLACLLGLACGPSLLSTHLCDQIFSQNLITTHLRKKHQKSS